MIKFQASAEASGGEWVRLTLSIDGAEIAARIVEGINFYTFVHKLAAGDHEFTFRFAYENNTINSCPGNRAISGKV